MIRELAQHPGGVHSSNVQLERWDTAQIGTQARRLVAIGQLFSAKVGHRNARYFSSAAARDAYIHSSAVNVARPRVGGTYQAGGNAPWSADEPGIETERTIYTQCPSHLPRFREHVMPFVHGGLRAA